MNNEGTETYIGRSSAAPAKRTLEQAIEDAWKKAKQQNPDATTFHVVSIRVEGTNPISDYVVELGV